MPSIATGRTGPRQTGRTPSAAERRPALARLVSVAPDEFASRYWGLGPLLSSAATLPGPFEDLLSAAAVDELLSQRGLRTPFLRVAKDGRTLADRAFTSPGGVGAMVADQVDDTTLLQLFADGHTLVLQGLHRTWEPIAEFAATLTADLGHPVQANAYVTPSQSTGFSDHYDVHDVFVLQVSGEKRWRVRPPVRQWPARDEPWTDRRADVDAAAALPPLLDVTLRPGDCLYLPRGYLHAATASGDVSIHVTLGIHTWTRTHVARAMADLAVSRVLEDVHQRAPLPLGVDLASADDIADDVETVRQALVDAVDLLDTAAVARCLDRRETPTTRPSAVGPLAQAARASGLTAASEVELRAHVHARLETDLDGSATLHSRAASLPVPLGAQGAVAALLATGHSTAEALGLDLARTLLRHGIVT